MSATTVAAKSVAQGMQVAAGMSVREAARIDRLEQLHVRIEIRLEPVPQGALAAFEHEVDHRRQQYQHAECCDNRAYQQQVETRVQRHGGQQSGQEDTQNAIGVPLGQRNRDECEDRRRTAVHDRGAKATDHLHDRIGFRARREVVQVFEHRETRSDRETIDRGVDQHADTPGPDQVHEQQRLQRFLDPGRHEAREILEGDVQRVVDGTADPIAAAGGEHSGRDRNEDGADPHDLEAVEIDQTR